MNDVKPIDQQTRAEQTRFLSREFVIGMVLQLALLGGGGLIAFTRLEAKVSQVEPAKVSELQQKVAVLEANQIDAQRVTRLESSMVALDKSMTRLQDTLDREIERRRK